MPPARTGVAEYSQSLVNALRRIADVDVNPPPSRWTANVYNVGNNLLHREIYANALRFPGAVLLHDAVLHHFFLGANDRQAYVDEFVYNYGEWHRSTAEHLWKDRAQSGHAAVYFRYPMLRRLLESARAVAVHNAAAARIVREHAPSVPVVEIPHLLEPPPPPPAVRLFPEQRFVFGIFGHLRESKRIPVVIGAFRRIRRAIPGAALVIAGEFVSPDLARAIPNSEPGIIRVPYLPERGFWDLAHSVDCCISLRYPSAAETSGIAIRLMGAGKPVIVTAGEETAAMPDTAGLRVDPGPPEAEMLAAYMLWLAKNPAQASWIGGQAAQHIRTHHDPDRAARLLLATMKN
ncbi:MAG: glycosyltransferase family 4 protein [Acidobacteria bacterium]|nr:glycosyltransferase family 4 protein [Acidobacteriota bacterium]